MSFAEELRVARARTRMSQTEAADLVSARGVPATQPQWSAWERGAMVPDVDKGQAVLAIMAGEVARQTAPPGNQMAQQLEAECGRYASEEFEERPWGNSDEEIAGELRRPQTPQEAWDLGLEFGRRAVEMGDPESFAFGARVAAIQTRARALRDPDLGNAFHLGWYAGMRAAREA